VTRLHERDTDRRGRSQPPTVPPPERTPRCGGTKFDDPRWTCTRHLGHPGPCALRPTGRASFLRLLVTCGYAFVWFLFVGFLSLGYCLGRGPVSERLDWFIGLTAWGGVFFIFWWRERDR
jgi:hypothetical protein